MTRLAAVLGIAPEGAAITAALAGASLVAFILNLWWLGAIVLMAAAAVGAFFRDPERTPPDLPEDAFISAADGRICDISEVSFPDASQAPCWRVGVFMSPLNVHVNRAPISGQVAAVEHKAGTFRAAFQDVASLYNERNLVIFSGADGRRYAIMQIAGYLARRIVCRVRPSDRVDRGQRVGLIMFGSRVDHFFPLEYRLMAKLGDHTLAGVTVLGELSDGQQ